MDTTDLVQETLLTAYSHRAELREPQAALAWLLRIADRLCLDQLRRKDTPKTVEPGESVEDMPDSSPTGLVMAERHEMSECTRKYVDRLAPSHRQVLDLHDVEGFSAKEIAARLGISEGAAKARLNRARESLKGQLLMACSFSRDDRGVFVCEPKTSSGR